ncbi:DUF4234 domain-containing protein [bacterium]|nr:DUF4234 domain-containing protein [bacterium]NBX97656.1 DUF4234 domain-containing protein [bacterium]NDC94129.1 DUF4234 domain-containing protein [bacterium]NDD83126.1 DUF4234 domain-containing protein [bacterium]NDG29349.1 DUF4234 domain-containing protein [bacterium]
MKKRSIVKMLILEIVTLGIYRLYWFIKTRKEMMALAKVDIPTPWIFVIPVFGYIFGFALLFASSLSGNSNPIAVLLFYAIIFASFIVYALWLWKYSKAVEVITNEKMSFALSLLILLAVPDGIDILVVQDYFNKVAEGKVKVPQGVTATS